MREVEEEEAMALTQLQSLVEEDQPHPPISLAPPTKTVIIHVQPDNVSTLYLIFIGMLQVFVQRETKKNILSFCCLGNTT